MKTFLARFVRPALYFPVDLFPFFPGDPRQGLKFKIIQVVARLDRPILNYMFTRSKP